MKRAEFIEAYNKLTDEQKKDYESMGYYCASSGEHYGKIASRCLYLAGALGGYYVPMSWLLKQRKYDFKGAKCNVFDLLSWRTQICEVKNLVAMDVEELLMSQRYAKLMVMLLQLKK